MKRPIAIELARLLREGMTRPQLALLYLTQAADELERLHLENAKLKKRRKTNEPV